MRPKKDPSEKRTKTIHFKLTPLELYRLQEVAHECGMNASDFCRARIFGPEPKQRLTIDEAALLRDVRRIRLDLDNVTHHWRVGAWPEVKAGLQQIVSKLKPILKL